VRSFGQAALHRTLLGSLWCWTGLVSMGLYPIDASLALLSRVGLAGIPAYITLFGGAAADLALGTALLVGWRVRIVCAAQLALMGTYTAIMTATMPEYWLDPFGPISKNLAVLSATLALMAQEK